MAGPAIRADQYQGPVSVEMTRSHHYSCTDQRISLTKKGKIMKRESAMPLRAALAAVALTFATLQASPAPAEEHCPKGDLPIAGTVEGRATTVGFIVGARWGEGTLTLNDGSQHKFTGKGAKLIETGVAEVTFKGNVYNLEKLEHFEGDYAAVSGGLTVIKGLDAGAVLKNDNCVYINVDTETEGLRLSAPAPGGVWISLEDW
jgi:hypothetical protein